MDENSTGKGLDAFAPKRGGGRGCKLNEFEAEEVKHWMLSSDPRQYGFDFGLWTREIVAYLIEDRFGIVLGLSAVGDLLHRQELTPQKPMRRAYEIDGEAITQWKETVYPQIKKEGNYDFSLHYPDQ